MVIKSKSQMPIRLLEIDLTGPNGNAFFLLEMAKDLAEQLSKDGDLITKEMMEGPYEHLVEVFDREFGDFVTLYR